MDAMKLTGVFLLIMALPAVALADPQACPDNIAITAYINPPTTQGQPKQTKVEELIAPESIFSDLSSALEANAKSDAEDWLASSLLNNICPATGSGIEFPETCAEKKRMELVPAAPLDLGALRTAFQSDMKVVLACHLSADEKTAAPIELLAMDAYAAQQQLDLTSFIPGLDAVAPLTADCASTKTSTASCRMVAPAILEKCAHLKSDKKDSCVIAALDAIHRLNPALAKMDAEQAVKSLEQLGIDVSTYKSDKASAQELQLEVSTQEAQDVSHIYRDLVTFGCSTSDQDTSCTVSDHDMLVVANLDMVIQVTQTSKPNYGRAIEEIAEAECPHSQTTEAPTCKYLFLVQGIVTAEDGKEVQAAVDNLTTTHNGWRMKTVAPMWSVSGILGLDIESDRYYGGQVAGTTYAKGVFGPIGIERSWTNTDGFSAVMLSLIDVGNVARVSSKQNVTNGSVDTTSGTGVQQVLSPGLLFYTSRGDSPFVYGVGISYTPLIRTATFTKGTTQDLAGTRVMVFIGINTTFLPFGAP